MLTTASLTIAYGWVLRQFNFMTRRVLRPQPCRLPLCLAHLLPPPPACAGARGVTPGRPLAPPGRQAKT
eukprot:3835419-Pyramimonas_sp.AAC.1